MLLRSLWLGAFTAYLFLGLSHVSAENIDDSLVCKICNGYQICGKKQTQMPECLNSIPCTMEQYRLCGKMADTVKSDECDHPGKFPDPKRPRKYFTCDINSTFSNSTSSFRKRTWSCSANKTFDPLTKHCLNTDEKLALQTLQNYVHLDKRFVCTDVGIFPDPYDCKMYHSCNKKLESQDFYCSVGTYFDGINCTNTKRCLKQLEKNSREQLNQGDEIYKRVRAMLMSRRSTSNSPRFLEESFEDSAGTKYTLYAVGDVQAPNVLSYTQSSIQNLQKIIKQQIREQQRMSVDGFLDLEKLQGTVTTIATKSIEEAKIMVDNVGEKICDRMQQMVDEGSLRLKVSLFNVMHVTIIQCNCDSAGNDTFKISTNLNPYYTTLDEFTNIQTTQSQQNATTKYYINGTAFTSEKYYTDITPPIHVAVDYEDDYQETSETQSSEEDYYYEAHAKPTITYEQKTLGQLTESTFYWYDYNGDTKTFSPPPEPKHETSVFANDYTETAEQYNDDEVKKSSIHREKWATDSFSDPEISYAQIYNKNKDKYTDESESVFYAGNEYDSIKTYKTKTTSHKYESKTTSSKKHKSTTTQFSSDSMSSNTDYNDEDEYTDASKLVVYADNEYDNTNSYQTKTTSSSKYESTGTAYSSDCNCENEYTDTAQYDIYQDNESDNTNSYQTEQTFSADYESTAIESSRDTYDTYFYSNSKNNYPDTAHYDTYQDNEYDNTNTYITTSSSEYNSTTIPFIGDSTAPYANGNAMDEYTDAPDFEIYTDNLYDSTNTYISKMTSPGKNKTKSTDFSSDSTYSYDADNTDEGEYSDASESVVYTDNEYDSINTYKTKTTSHKYKTKTTSFKKHKTKITQFGSDSLYSYDADSNDEDEYTDSSESVFYTDNEYDTSNTYKTKTNSSKKQKSTTTQFNSDTVSPYLDNNDEDEYKDVRELVYYTGDKYEYTNDYDEKTTSLSKNKTTEFSSDHMSYSNNASNDEDEYINAPQLEVYTASELDINTYKTKTTSPRKNKTTSPDYNSDSMYFYDADSNEENEYTVASESVVYTDNEYDSTNTYKTKTTSPRKNKTAGTDYNGDSMYSYDAGSNEENEYTVESESVAYTDNEYDSTNTYKTKTTSPRKNETTSTDYSSDSMYFYDADSNEENEYTVASESVVYTDNEYDSTNTYKTKTTSPRKNKTASTDYSGDSMYSYDAGSNEENEYFDSSGSVVYTENEYDSISTYKTKTTSHKYKTKTTSSETHKSTTTQFNSDTMSPSDPDNNDEDEYKDVRELYDYNGDKYKYTNAYDEKTTAVSKNKTTQFSSDSISDSYTDSNGEDEYTEETDDYTFDENSQTYEIKTVFSDSTNVTSETLLLDADTTAELPRPYSCVHAGYFTDPDDCHSFYRCEAIASSTKRHCSKCKNKYEWKLVASHHTCRNGRFFSELYWKCVTNKPDTCIH